MTINESMKAHEEYISFLNNEVLADCDRNKLSDAAYMTEILKKNDRRVLPDLQLKRNYK